MSAAGLRRAIAALVVVAATAGAVWWGARHDEVADAPRFTSLGEPTMPFVPAGSFVSSSWYCPGVPVGASGTGGRVVVANTGDEQLSGHITVYTDAEGVGAATAPITVEPRTSTSLELTRFQASGTFLAALVEIDGGGGFVEQEAQSPSGNAVAACSNATSSNWWFAEGYTLDGSEERLVLTNPFPDTAIVDIAFVTEQGSREPSRFQGLPVPGHSVRVVDFGAKDEPSIAAQVVASRGRVVAARSERFGGGGRVGYTMSLGAPSLATQYYFADGEVGDGITEQYRVYNPTDQEVSVDVNFLGITGDAAAGFTNDTALTVAARDVVTLDTKDVDGLPPGRHGAVFSTLSAPAIVVERVISRPAAGSVATTVVMGSPSVLASTRWSGAISSGLAIEDVLVVLNVDNVDTTVSLSTLGPGGLVPVTGLDAVPLPAGGVITIPMTDPAALGRAFVVRSAQRLYVERLLPRRDDLRGRSGSFALAG